MARHRVKRVFAWLMRGSRIGGPTRGVCLGKLSHGGCLERLVRDEEGITTAGMAVSLMLCLALTFSGAQIYRVNSAASEVQEVADVAALAAENEVAEFMVAVKVCDAAVLSMTLLSATVYAIGVVCAVVPPLSALSSELVSLGRSISNARDDFYEAAVSGLDTLQRMLPFLSAAAASSVAAANNNGAMDANYLALAVLVPQEGVPLVHASGSSLSDLGDQVESSAQDIRDKSARLEELAEKANEAKQRGYAYDCGNSVTGALSGRCMYERASHLGGLSGGSNPLFSSVDAWDFNQGFRRAESYYLKRSHEARPAGSLADVVSWSLRTQFYDYAWHQIEACYVIERDDGVLQSNVLHLFKNTNELRNEWIYHDLTLAVSGGVMHAYHGCPAIGSIEGYYGIDLLDNGTYTGCDVCGLTIDSFGNIASATTNVPTGFEYHYERFCQAADDYVAAMQELMPLKAEIQGEIGSIMDAVGQVVDDAASNRISAESPGSDGAIVMLVNTAQNAADTGFESMFVGGGTVLGTRAAVAGASLVEDSTHDNGTVITSLLDGFGDGGGAAVGAARIVLDCWSSLLKVYEDGQVALMDAIEEGLNALPVNTAGGLGTWASEALKSVIATVGLQPANLKALKPALLNTEHVAASDSGAFAVKFKQVKTNALAVSSPATGSLAGLSAFVSDAVTQTVSGTTITIAEIAFPIGGASIPITLTLPPSVGEAAGGFVGQCIDAVAGAVGVDSGVRQWQ